MGALIAVSIVALLIVLLIPSYLLGLIGMFPIAIGIKELIELRKGENDKAGKIAEKKLRSKFISYLPFLTVAAVTFSGGEEIGIYSSVFATNNEASEIATVTMVTLLLTGAWSAIAYYLANRSFIARRVQRLGGIACHLS
jgi:cadmium resistance protein CadD (predicted permease)